MRKKVGLFAIVVLMLMFAIGLTACTDNHTDLPPKDTLNIGQVYAMAVDAGYSGTLEELIAAFKGDSAYQIAVAKGFTGSEADWLASLVGASGTNGTTGQDGASGSNGISPHIGTNGNWYIGTTDTGVKAHGANGSNGTNGTDGENGTNGTDGENGKSAYQIWLDNGNSGTEADFLTWLKGSSGNNGTDGTNGKSAYELYMKYNSDYPGSEEQWVNALANGRLVRFTITFKAAGSADIVKSVFYGYSLIDTDIPSVPVKSDITGVWDTTRFTNITKNMTVTAIYRLTFSLTNNDTAYRLVSSNLSSDEKVLVIPSEHEGKPVIGIGSQAFMDNSTLTSITIPNSVTSIGSFAFKGCTSLASITIPDSVTIIGESAFKGCEKLQYEIYDSNLCYLNNAMISVVSNSIVVVAFKPKTTVIAAYAFEGCKNLTSITIPDSLTMISEYAFKGCTKLTAVIIPNTVTTIGGSAFNGCTSLKSITIPDSVTTIREAAFAYCGGLTSIVIPVSVTRIDERAFYDCSGLKQVYYGGAVLAAWESIAISSDYNSALINAKRFYYSEAATNDGAYWRFVNGVPTIWA